MQAIVLLFIRMNFLKYWRVPRCVGVGMIVIGEVEFPFARLTKTSLPKGKPENKL